jgi:putative heme transporter
MTVRPSSRLETARRVLARRELRILARAMAIGIVAVALVRSRSLLGEVGNIGQPNLIWLLAAAGAESVSLVAYAAMVRELLRLGGTAPPIKGVLRPTLVGIAMGASLPAGAAASNVYWYKQLRRLGADRRLAALAMTASSGAETISLVALFAVGVAAAGNAGPLAAAHNWLLGAAALALVVRLAFSHRLGRLLTWLIHKVDPSIDVQVGRLRRVILLAHGNWILDCVALYAALVAVDAAVPVRGVLLVYVLSQLVANVALIPGGGGTVELSLVAGFTAFGHHAGTLLAGVLLYRIISCWGLIPVGWSVVLSERTLGARTRQTPDSSAPAIGLGSQT